VRHQAIADMRYAAQSFTVATDVGAEVAARAPVAAFAEAFHAEHLRLFGHNDPQGQVAFNELRLRLSAALPKPGATPDRNTGGRGAVAPIRHRRVRYAGAWHEATPVYAREKLPVAWTGKGLAIIEQDNATILVPPGFAARVGDYGDLVMTKES